MSLRATVAIAVCLVIFLATIAAQAGEGVHLVMLTGDGRMEKLDERVSFVPALQTALGEDEVVVVKAAWQKKHLGHWHDGWVGEFRGREVRESAQGWILHDLIQKARAAVGEQKVQSASVVWAQGESDARDGFSAAYEPSFRAITAQLAENLGRNDISVVIARLGAVEDDRPDRYPDWKAIREVQEKLGNLLPRASWVDTDAVAVKSKEYSESLGELLADATLHKIRDNAAPEAAPLPAREVPQAHPPAHLFLLSGQSNMANLNPEEAFVPAVVEAFGADRVIVVKAAYGAKAIRHWVKRNSKADSSVERNWLYLELVGKTKFAIADREIESMTFCWMQGESDASAESTANAYAENFEAVLQLLRRDLGREDINFVIGRLSDHSHPEKYPAWEQIRAAQMKLADRSPRGRWIDTDAFNGDEDGLHYPSGEGGRLALARSFAVQAIELAHTTPSQTLTSK